MSSEKRKSSSTSAPPPKKPKTDTSNGISIHPSRQPYQKHNNTSKQPFHDISTSSREAHAKQKALRADRLAAKPNADSIARSKKIWERLRIKSAVPKDERQTLVAELFEIIRGRVKEFVFKHDSVRVIQCAIKYATPEQKRVIAKELQGSYRELAESRYAKFLVAKLIVVGGGEGGEVRDVVVPEFYGHVKRLMRHPEGSWILDDIYRTVATPDQKARLLREWYGGEFAVGELQKGQEGVTAELSEILKESPGKRGPIMQYLKEMTNQLVQKKTTGFTMLHDAMLQYFLNCVPGSPEHGEFLEMLRDDEEGDLFRNLAFTKSGARIVCLALAHGTSKDRRTILKHFKTHIRLMSLDPHAHLVILAAYEVIDDTVMTSKAIFNELTCKELDSEPRDQELLLLSTHINARIPLLHLMSATPPKWLLDPTHHTILSEIKSIRPQTSKKAPETRRQELNKSLSPPLLEFITRQLTTLLQSSYGCQFIGEIILGSLAGNKTPVLEALISYATTPSTTSDELSTTTTPAAAQVLSTPHAGRLYKSLVQGGRFDPATKAIILSTTTTGEDSDFSPLGFGNMLYTALSTDNALLDWSTGVNSWCIVAMLESEVFEHKDKLTRFLEENRAVLEGKSGENGGVRVLLESIGVAGNATGKGKEQKQRESKGKGNERKKGRRSA